MGDTGEPPDYDVVIIGSGYGGAVAAQTFAGRLIDGRPARVCVLERGKSYQPADFPAEAALLPGHVRFDTAAGKAPRGEREGLFDLRIGADVCTLVANGLGGGSLINAGVMLAPADEVLASKDWPDAIRDGASLRHFLEKAHVLLDGVSGSPGIDRLPPAGAALQRLAKGIGKGNFSSPPLSIALDDDQRTEAGVTLKRCRRCSDCMTGCRHGSKRSLDTSLLAVAWLRGARIFTGATVLQLARREPGPGWLLDVVHTDAKLRKRQGEPLRLSARRVVLAAGSLGSTEILMRSRSRGQLEFAGMLGRNFSTNGDMIAVAWGLHPPDAGVGTDAGLDADVGPTISAMLDLRGTNGPGSRDLSYAGIVVQSLVIPAALRRLYEEVVTTTHALNTLDRADSTVHSRTAGVDPCAVSAEALDRTLAVAMMGDDGAAGQLELRAGSEGDAAIDVRWPELRNHPLFRQQVALLDELLAHSGADVGADVGTGGGVRGSADGGAGSSTRNALALPNPLWSPIREPVASILGVDKGPLLTVHPLGGCRMGENSSEGVVNHLGQVFDPDSGGVHDGLVVLDGSIVPRALGINPALTIAALALRACETLVSEWGFGEQPRGREGSFGRELADSAGTQAETLIELRERMSGLLRLASRDGGSRLYRVELTLNAEGATLRQLAAPMGLNLNVAPQREPGAPGGLLRVFAIDDWERIEHPRRAADLGRGDDDIEVRLENAALISVPVSGSICLLVREDSTPRQRRRRALRAWLCNRGTRDIVQNLDRLLSGGGTITSGWRIATRAGEARVIDYELMLGEPRKLARTPEAPATAPFAASAPVKGSKRLTYATHGNPWRQLSELEITTFPALLHESRASAKTRRGTSGEPQASPGRPVLALDTAYLARVQTPLLRIVAHPDQPNALIDLASVTLYWFRLLLSIHLWSFREPDARLPGEPQRLPGSLPGLPRPSIHSIPLGTTPGGEPVTVRLTRYAAARSAAAQPPVVLIHGYSTSGACFAHPEVDPNLASWLWQRGRDVWVVDLRTSSGLPTATLPWRFEDAALVDLPEAFAWIRDRIRRERGSDAKLDVVAHCMGAVMFSMAVLRPPPDPAQAPEDPDSPPCSARLARIRRDLPHWIGRVVLSQAGPMLAFDRANVFRAYVMRWLRHFLPLTDYRFRVDPPVSQLDRLIDRALATLPYPEHEFRLENPLFRSAPFVATRHRMDALYGRDFELANMAPGVLDRIDDLFGPLNIETVSQTLHFARHKTITDRGGRAVYASTANIVQRWRFPTLYLHSARSGLFDRTTAALIEARFAAAGVPLVNRSLDELGHQDSLIGRKAEPMFAEISEWLDGRPLMPDGHGGGAGPKVHRATNAQPATGGTGAPVVRLSVRPPAFGPIVCASLGSDDELEIRFGTEPAFGPPERLVLVPVSRLPTGGLARGGELAPLWLERCGDGWWRTTAMLAPLRTRVDAVLILIVRGHPAWAGDPCSPLPDYGDVREAIEAAIDTELREASATLEPGLLLLDDHRPCDCRSADSDCDRHRGQLDSRTREVRRRQPAPGTGFLLASCQYPAGMLDSHVAEASFRRMLALLDAAGSAIPRALLLLGDTIYADATAGLFDPVHADERLAARYRALLAIPPLRKILRRLRVLAMPDDHEIFDNWEPTAPPPRAGTVADSEAARALTDSRAAFLAVFGGGDRGRVAGHHCDGERSRSREDDPDESRLWFETCADGHPIFMLDTRTARSHRDPARIVDATILDDRQARCLEDWLLRGRDHAGPRFIASPSMPLPRRRLPAG
ncbi:MAG TPA: GMC oxidoreductase, partial [Burkholderiaceae bacterium]|nr:GMC oxidoreductase [Burkholderiaceae bacterium]